MPEYVLLTTGSVNRDPVEWSDLGEFVQGYIECLFFTENEPGTDRKQRVNAKGQVRKAWAHRATEGQQKDMPGDYGFADLSGEALDRITHDCARFVTRAARALDLAYERNYDEMQAGRDFWFTRNGHGVGFWDRKELEGPVGASLTAICKEFHEIDAYIGDDLKVHLS